ncbi:MAG: AzlC family ABC transporter permease [Anaerovoracaceae bacterium]|jgi:4-azaleucine resistance transporter AzlC
MESNRSILTEGMRDGWPIGVGYFAVSFALGITARNAGFAPLAGFIFSATTYASAGQYVGITLFTANATLIQIVAVTLITNARYLLMGLSLNQRIPGDAPIWHRLLIGTAITDEIFGITIAHRGKVHPLYPIGAFLIAMPLWASGTAMGIVMGNVLPSRAVSALSVALFGMFLAVIIPPARRDRKVALFIAISFAASYALTELPVVSGLSAGNRTIILTLAISAAAAFFCPVSKERMAALFTVPVADGDKEKGAHDAP